MTPPESHPSASSPQASFAAPRVRVLTPWDERVLKAITTDKKEGVANWTILPNEYGSGGEITRSLQKLKRRGLAVIVSKRRGDTWWRATQRPNAQAKTRPEL